MHTVDGVKIKKKYVEQFLIINVYYKHLDFFVTLVVALPRILFQ